MWKAARKEEKMQAEHSLSDKYISAVLTMLWLKRRMLAKSGDCRFLPTSFFSRREYCDISLRKDEYTDEKGERM